MSNIEKIVYPAPKQEYKVLVRCYTYNHSKYIEDALNGFAIQQTNFPFVCIVIDDASTDGAQEVIKKWMGSECDMDRAETIDITTSIVIIVPHKTNLSCTFAFYLLKQNLFLVKGEKKKHVDPWREKCEYEALCEGDDYWMDSLKLQKQVEFLDANIEYGLVFTNFQYVDTRGNVTYPILDVHKNLESRVRDGYLFDFYLCNTGFIMTCTVCYKLSKRKHITDGIDTALFMDLQRVSKVKYLNDCTTSYRITPGGMMMSQEKRVNSLNLQNRVNQLYNSFKCLDTLEYYKTDKKSRLRHCYAYYSSVYNFIRGNIKGWRKIVYITIHNPLYLICFPYYLYVILKNKSTL